MPTFSEYFLAPWKIFALLGIGSSSAVANGSIADSTSVCFSQNLDGQILNICRIAGYQMPSFVLWASLMIIILFVASSVRLIQQCSTLANTLNRVADHITQLSKAHPNHVTSQELARIRDFMLKEKLVAHPWEEFEETLLLAPESKDVYSTCAIESIMTKAALIDENVNSAFFNAIPGILTGLGLLMTFIAILDGLSHVSVAANMDVKGIGGLINGLSGKFVSSIVAVTCAVLFAFVERFAYHKPNAAYRMLISSLARRFRRRTTEHLLHAIQLQLHHNLSQNQTKTASR